MDKPWKGEDTQNTGYSSTLFLFLKNYITNTFHCYRKPANAALRMNNLV